MLDIQIFGSNNKFFQSMICKIKYASDGDTQVKILIATSKNKKCVYISCCTIPHVTTGPEYNKNWRNSVALLYISYTHQVT